jgi:plastocyanin
MKKSKNIYVFFIGIVLFVSVIGLAAAGAVYSNEYNNPNQITIQEGSPSSMSNDIVDDSGASKMVTSSSNFVHIETFRIYSASATILGSYEIPGVHSQAFAIGEFLIDPTTNTLTYNIIGYDIGNETRAEIIGPATNSVNSNNTLLTLTNTAGQKTGVWNYPQSIESDLLKGRTYVNIFTTQNPNGEIRGQILMKKVYTVRRMVDVPKSNTFQVNITNSSFTQNTTWIKKGDTVVWKNYGNSSQTIRSDVGSELNSGILHIGDSFTHKFNLVGNYSYHSNINPHMHGMVVVANQ